MRPAAIVSAQEAETYLQKLEQNWFLPQASKWFEQPHLVSELENMSRWVVKVSQMDPAEHQIEAPLLSNTARCCALMNIDRGRVNVARQLLGIADRLHIPHQQTPEALFDNLTSILLDYAHETTDSDRHAQVSKILFCLVELAQQPNQYRWSKSLVDCIMGVLKGFALEHFSSKSKLANILCGFMESNFGVLNGLVHIISEAQKLELATKKPKKMSEWEFVYYKVFIKQEWKIEPVLNANILCDAHFFTQLPPAAGPLACCENDITQFLKRRNSGGTIFRLFLQNIGVQDYQPIASPHQDLEIHPKAKAAYERIVSEVDMLQRMHAVIDEGKMTADRLGQTLYWHDRTISERIQDLVALATQTHDHHLQACAKYYLLQLALQEKTYRNWLRDINILKVCSDFVDCLQSSSLVHEANGMLQSYHERQARLSESERRVNPPQDQQREEVPIPRTHLHIPRQIGMWRAAKPHPDQNSKNTLDNSVKKL